VVHPTAHIYPGAWIGGGVEIGAGCSVGPGTVLGFARLDEPCGHTIIGENVHLGPHVCVEPGAIIEPEVRVGFSACIRTGTRIGRGAHVGERCVLMGNCNVGECVVLLAEVHVCEHAELLAHCQLMTGVILINDPYPPTGLTVHGPTIGECAIVGVNSVIWPGVKLGYHSMVGSMSEVKHDVADYTLVRGCPAKPICDVRKIRMKLRDKWVYPYPWMRHGIPDEDLTKPAL